MLLEFDSASAGAGQLPPARPAAWAARPGIAAARTANPPLAVLADTLRAPLMPIIGFAQLLQSEATTRQGAHHHAVEIEAAATSLLAVLDALLARANGRGMPADTKPCVAEAAEDALRAWQTLLEYSRFHRYHGDDRNPNG